MSSNPLPRLIGVSSDNTLSGLNTTDKSSLVNAINEALKNGGGGGVNFSTWTYTSTANSTTTFTIPSVSYDSSVDTLQLYYNGDLLVLNENYSISGLTVTLGWGINIGEEIYAIIIKKDNTGSIIGSLSDLTTTVKDNLVDSINEVNGKTNKIGNLTGNGITEPDLSTAIKNDRVELNNLMNYYSDILAKYIKLMQDGSAVVIDCKGDSTYWGQTTGGIQTSEPVNVVLQKVLQGYFNNTNIVVNNQGVQGYATSDVINSWDSYLASTSANIIFINYCLNDPYKGTTPEQYKANLKTMVLKTRAIGKEIVFDLPNQTFNIPTINTNTNQTLIESSKYYANIMNAVAVEFEVPIINNIDSVSDFLEYFKSPTDILCDGVHPLQSFYNFKAIQMARVLIYNEREKNNEYIPCYSNLYKYYGNILSGTCFNGAKYAWGATNIRVAFWVEKASDLTAYLLLPPSTSYATSNSLATSINVILDNTAVLTNYNLVMNNSTATNPAYKEILLGKNLKRGLHYLEINGVDNPIWVHYLRLLPASFDNEVISVNKGNLTKKISNGSRYFERYLSPIPITNINTVIEFDAYMCDGFGLELVGERPSSTDLGVSCVTSGVLISGELRGGIFYWGLSQTCDNIYYTTADKKVLSNMQATLNTWQNVKLLIDVTNNLLKLYYNNTQIASLTLLDSKLAGGFISLIRASSDSTTDTTMYIKNLQYRYGANVIV